MGELLVQNLWPGDPDPLGMGLIRGSRERDGEGFGACLW